MTVIKKISKAIFNKYYRSVEDFIDRSSSVQEENLSYLLEHGRNTLIGSEYNFDKIDGIPEFQKRVPVFRYEDLRPYLDKIIIDKKSNVLWDTPIRWFAMSSGTTNDKSKYIPVTRESLVNCHYRCGRQMLGLYTNQYPDSSFVFGKTLVIGGSQQVNNIGDGIFTGDISAVLMKNLPFLVKLARTPEALAMIPDWEKKLEQLSLYARKEDVRALLGVPSWMLVLLKKIVSDTGHSIPELWKNIEVFFHGGVSFSPYHEQYEEIIPTGNMRYWETYNASEGFFGVQFSEKSKDMLLMLNNEIFYEFIPDSEWKENNPKTVVLSEVEVGKQYAMVITTSGGLWRYEIGDTIEFTSTNPYLFRITGRTKQFINAFGEELIVDNTDRAIKRACSITNSKILEYTVAPVYFGNDSSGAHEWYIEFEKEPNSIESFTAILDESLKSLNSDYEAKRSYNLSLGMPIVRVLKPGDFYKWMEHRKKIGGQNKVPKLSNNRNYVDDISSFLNEKY